ncbi:MAG: peptidoglycan DD-metalloendopeptidase family protein [Polaribacter sp.]|nr:peptidoglycan DD-metalloendopeptidase family protein [Polaribacter sp.]MDG1810964.1 peptidoglycan DD-metalloendopeptidase family protein [Polaribacter sp.]MDG1993995.1 peptidoglycan DD-metalloendopeptidase family protein [Polaribacter sp.]
MDKKQASLKFKNWSKNNQFSLKNLFPTINKSETIHIDLSINNTNVKTEAEFNNPAFFEAKLADIQEKNPSKIIAGGYLEKRALYTSDIYNSENSTEKRNIHLGIDYWLPKNTPIHAPFNGEIMCAVHQKSFKGYGGFIILKHTFSDIEFYTLYGHLSAKSILKYKKGDTINKDQEIGLLGNYSENGEWVPHLHFQVMLSLLNYKNDFPGVVLESEINFWKTICPNPKLLFKS